MSDDPLVDGVPLSTLKVLDLRRELEQRGLSKSGNKKDLVDRLKTYLTNERQAARSPVAESAGGSAAGSPTKVNKLVAKYLEQQQAALEVSKREAEMVRCQSNQSSPTKQSDTEHSHTESFSSDQHDDGHESVQSDEKQKATPRKSRRKRKGEPMEVPEEHVEEEPAKAARLESPEAHGKFDEQDTVESVAAQNVDVVEQVAPVVEQNVEPVPDEPEPAQVAPEQPQQVEFVDLQSQEPVQAEMQESNDETAKEPTDQIVPDETSGGHHDDEKSAHSESRPGSAGDAGQSGEVDNGEELELDYEEDLRTVENAHSSPQKSHESADEGLAEKTESESKTEPKPYVEDRFDFLKNLNKTDTPTTNEKTELGLVRAKALSPARQTQTRFVHVHKLKRPFAAKALFGLLKTFGDFDETDDFWIDAIKSNCIVRYESEESASKARDELHNVIWPEGNGQYLLVDFSTEEKFEYRKSGGTAKDPIRPTPEKSARPSHEPGPSAQTPSASVEQPPSVADQPPAPKETRRPSPGPHKPANAAAPRDLEEIFRKTKTQPMIYYLPLTDEEAEKRWAEKKAAETERTRRETPPIRASGSKPSGSAAPRRLESSSAAFARRRPPSPGRRARRRSASRSPDRKRARRQQMTPPRHRR